ncbi:MAG: carbohydrate ABC transporter permease [Spirochaetota bacterium]
MRDVTRGRSGRYKTRKNLLKNLRGLAILLAIFLAVFPLLWVLLASFKTPGDLMRVPPVLVFRPTLANYLEVAGKEMFFIHFRNSAIVSVGSVALCVGLGIPAAFGLSRFAIPGRKTIMMVVLGVRFMPYIVFALPLFLLMVQLGLIGTLHGLVFVYILINLPLVIWLMRAFFDDIPRDIDEAAAIDGASQRVIFFRVVLPCALPGVATVTILSLIFAWNEYLFALILSGRYAQTVTVGLTRFLGGMETAVRWGLLSAWSIAVVTPIVVVALLLNRHLRRGFTSELGK